MAMTPEQLQKVRDNLAKARAVKAAKANGQPAPEVVREAPQRKIRMSVPRITEDDIVVEKQNELRKRRGELDEDQQEIIRSIEQRGKNVERKFRATDEQPDPKYIPPHLIPDGWSFEWKTITVMGQPIEELRPGYLSDLEQNCWEAVPSALLRSRLPRSYTGKTVDIGGQRLMMRPKSLTDEAKKEYKALAEGRLQEQTKALNETPKGELERRVQTVRRSYEPAIVPDEM